jgi:hypothetical protein
LILLKHCKINRSIMIRILTTLHMLRVVWAQSWYSWHLNLLHLVLIFIFLLHNSNKWSFCTQNLILGRQFNNFLFVTTLLSYLIDLILASHFKEIIIAVIGWLKLCKSVLTKIMSEWTLSSWIVLTLEFALIDSIELFFFYHSKESSKFVSKKLTLVYFSSVHQRLAIFCWIRARNSKIEGTSWESWFRCFR